MGKTSRKRASDHLEAEGFEGHYAEVEGYTIGFERYTADADLAPLYRGLPDDRCQCPHWGVVLKGKVRYVYADGEDELGEGEAYVARPGHTTAIFAGTEVIEFSPTEELQPTLEVVSRNMEAASGS